MVIPYEPGYQAALMHDGNLFNDGQEKKVYVVSHNLNACIKFNC